MKTISATIKSKHRNSNGNSFFYLLILLTFLPGNVSSVLESLLYFTQSEKFSREQMISLSYQAAVPLRSNERRKIMNDFSKTNTVHEETLVYFSYKDRVFRMLFKEKNASWSCTMH